MAGPLEPCLPLARTNQGGLWRSASAFSYATYNDLDSVKAWTAVVMLELVQGESGVLPAQALTSSKTWRPIRKGNPAHRGRGSNGDGDWQTSPEHTDLCRISSVLPRAWPMVYLPGPFWVVVNWVLPSLSGSHGSTFGGNKPTCSGRAHSLDIFERGWLLETVQENSQFLLGRTGKEASLIDVWCKSGFSHSWFGLYDWH